MSKRRYLLFLLLFISAVAAATQRPETSLESDAEALQQQTVEITGNTEPAIEAAPLTNEQELQSVESAASVESVDNVEEEKIIIDSLQSLFTVLSTANKLISYQSLITYEANGFITTYKLQHRVTGDRIEEYLMVMDGPKRQVVRQQGLSQCAEGITRWGLWPTQIPENTLSTYQLQTRAIERIANREAVVFDIVPTDELRYGYRYSVDSQTGLVLRAVTYHNDTIIERLQTVSINIDPNVELSLDESDYAWRVPEVEPCFSTQFTPAWKVNWLPPGFDYVGNRITAKGEQVLIFADGLTSVSIFIVENSAPLAKATARHGATVVVVSPVASRPDKSIAVVGEIPTATARKIAVSVRPL